jgi:hypothetical protein
VVVGGGGLVWLCGLYGSLESDLFLKEEILRRSGIYLELPPVSLEGWCCALLYGMFKIFGHQ